MIVCVIVEYFVLEVLKDRNLYLKMINMFLYFCYLL